jgi:hypothetical protein
LRDIQARLKDLLPSDYTKKFHQYRPRNGTSANVRLEGLQQHRQARKSGAVRFAKDKQTLLSTRGDNTHPLTDPYQDFEGPLSAFRNYYENQSVSVKWQQLSLSAHPSESQLITPSLLLLDGSSVPSTSVNPNSQRQSTAIQCPNSQSTPDLSLEQSQEPIRPTSPSSTASIQSLQARLPRHAASVIRHVRSVLRYSSSNSSRSSTSVRSSWVSFRSQMSINSAFSTGASLLDGDSISLGTETKDLDTCPSERIYYQRPVQSATSPASPGIRANTVNIRMRSPSARHYSSVLKRRGCDCIFTLGKQSPLNNWPNQCGNCGLAPVHLLALNLAGVNHIWDFHLEINRKDFLDNRPLHFAAMTSQTDPEIFIKLVDMGADVGSVTTRGETFLHLLFRHLSAKNVSKFIPLLRRLEALNFSFTSRDYFGRQPFHALLRRRQGGHDLLNDVGTLQEIFAIAKPDFDAPNCAGHSLRSLLSTVSASKMSKCRVNLLLSSYPTSKNITVDFQIKMRNLLSKTEYNWSILAEWLAIENRLAWIDQQGNTALIALLKYWSFDQDELLLEDIIKWMVRMGAQIHMRDRKGETALAIAARRGLRPAVTTLIASGASIHSTTLRGLSILKNARKSLSQAKRDGDDKLYARVWSCIVYLVDLKACEFPSERRERWAAWAPDSHFGWEGKGEKETNIHQALVDLGVL